MTPLPCGLDVGGVGFVRGSCDPVDLGRWCVKYRGEWLNVFAVMLLVVNLRVSTSFRTRTKYTSLLINPFILPQLIVLTPVFC